MPGAPSTNNVGHMAKLVEVVFGSSEDVQSAVEVGFAKLEVMNSRLRGGLLRQKIMDDLTAWPLMMRHGAPQCRVCRECPPAAPEGSWSETALCIGHIELHCGKPSMNDRGVPASNMS